MKKKVAIIGTRGLPARYSGFETLVEHLTRNLNEQFDLTVFCSSQHFQNKLKEYQGAQLKYLSLSANGWQSIFYDILSMIKAARRSDAMFIMGVSGCIFLPLLKLLTRGKIKIVTNVDGIEWKREKWGKWASRFLKFSEKMAAKFSDVVVGDNYYICEHIKQSYKVKSTYIPYGGDHVLKTLEQPLSNEEEDFLSKLPEKYACTVCRIEPENNIEMILNAFSNCSEKKIVMVGNWKNSSFGINLRKKFCNFKNIQLIDPIFDQRLLNRVRSGCEMYFHGHKAGGTNPSIVEAMWLGLPIIAFNVNFNRSSTGDRAIYFSSSVDIENLLNENLPLKKIGISLKEYAEEKYSWKDVASAYAKAIT